MVAYPWNSLVRGYRPLCLPTQRKEKIRRAGQHPLAERLTAAFITCDLPSQALRALEALNVFAVVGVETFARRRLALAHRETMLLDTIDDPVPWHC